MDARPYISLKSWILSGRIILILLWLYAASAKLLKFGDFHDQMQLQVLPESIKLPLIYLLPPFEIILALLLLSESKFAKGLYISITLLTAFTTYIGLAIFGGLGHIPCSCGGVLEKLSWKEHLTFNLFFIVINLTTIRLLFIERRFSGEVT